MIANLMLTAGHARWIRKQRVPGIVITDSLLQLLEEEETAPR